MNKLVCDRCGKDIEDVFIRYKLVSIPCIGILSNDCRNYDLCNTCKKELIEWVKGDK